MWKESVVFLPLVLFVALCGATNPGLKIRITQGGLDYAAKEAIKILSHDIKGQHLPDQSGSDHVKVGKVEYGVSGITITSFTPPSSTVKMDAAKGITWVAQGGQVAVHANWRYKYRYHFIKVSDHGSLDVSASGVTFTVSIKLGMDATGHPTITPTGCSANTGSLKVKFHGGASWLYNIFDHQIEKSLKKTLIKTMCDSAKSAIIKDASKSLTKLKLDVKIDDNLALDYKLVSPPSFKAGYVDSFHKGEVFWKKQPSKLPFQPAALPSSTSSNKMMYMYISDYLMNSMAYVMHDHGLLVYNLTQYDLSGSDRDMLNTTCPNTVCMGTVLFPLADLYPNSRMALYIKSKVAPKVSISPGSLNAHAQGTIKFNVQKPDGSEDYVFAVDISLTAELTASIKNEHFITGKITKITPEIKVIDTKIGTLADSALTAIVQIAANILLPQLNAMGAQGLEIPNVDDLHFVKPVLTLEQGSLMINTDLKYVPATH